MATPSLRACTTSRAAGAEQANPDGSVNANITLPDLNLELSITDIQPSVGYHFNAANDGQLPQQFMIMPITMAKMGRTDLSGMSMEEKDSRALRLISRQQLFPGATAEADYIFIRVPQGQIEIVCTLPGH